LFGLKFLMGVTLRSWVDDLVNKFGPTQFHFEDYKSWPKENGTEFVDTTYIVYYLLILNMV